MQSESEIQNLSFKEKLERNIVWWSLGMLASGFGVGFLARSFLPSAAQEDEVNLKQTMTAKCLDSLDRLELDAEMATNGPECATQVREHRLACEEILVWLDHGKQNN